MSLNGFIYIYNNSSVEIVAISGIVECYIDIYQVLLKHYTCSDFDVLISMF